MEYNNEYNLDLYPKKLHWKEGDLTATRTTMWSGPGAMRAAKLSSTPMRTASSSRWRGDPTRRSTKAACACAASSCPSL